MYLQYCNFVSVPSCVSSAFVGKVSPNSTRSYLSNASGLNRPGLLNVSEHSDLNIAVFYDEFVLFLYELSKNKFFGPLNSR